MILRKNINHLKVIYFFVIHTLFWWTASLCLLNLPFWEKLTPHRRHWHSLFLSWTPFTWIFILCFWLKVASQRSHFILAFSSWTLLTCLFNPLLLTKIASQKVHLNFSFLWWTFSMVVLLKCHNHSRHMAKTPEFS